MAKDDFDVRRVLCLLCSMNILEDEDCDNIWKDYVNEKFKNKMRVIK